jgi:tetrahydromethanopterin S-methyltransferase subunit G
VDENSTLKSRSPCQPGKLHVDFRLPDQEFTEAAKVPGMIAQTPERLDEYNARVKAQRDEEARIIYAQQQGIEIGEARGIRWGLLQGKVLQLQQLLQRFKECEA